MMSKFRKKKGEAGDKVAKKMAEMQAAKEAKWRVGVMMNEDNSDANWLELGAWKATKEKKEKSKIEQDAAKKARRVMLKKVHTGVTKKLVLMLSEITSQCFTNIEGTLRKTDDKTGAVINALNAVVITCHLALEDPKDQRWEYLRRLGSDKLTALVCEIFDDAPNAEKGVMGIKETICALVAEREAEIGELISSKIDATLEGGAGAVAAHTPRSGAGGAAAAAVAAEGGADTEAMVDGLAGSAKAMALGKSKETIDAMCATICQVLDNMAAAYDEAKEEGCLNGDGNLNEEGIAKVQEKTYGVVMSENEQVYEAVSSQVQVLVFFLGKLMNEPEAS